MNLRPSQFAFFAFYCSSFALLASAAFDVDNAVVGEPEVQCGADTVEMQFRTKRAFRGKVYIKGHYTNPECRVDYSEAARSNSTAKPTGGIVVHHGACDMARQRMISPQGMQFSAVVVVSFHPTFITKLDKAYNLKCMYRELVRTVTSSVEVSMLTTQVLAYSFPMPVCTYTIRRDEIDGEILRYARVGEQVVHRWECQSDVYGILVHSCVVEDGQGEKIEVVDSKGCHVDDYVLGDPTYVEALNMAYREAHVVKFADRVSVRFQCQMKLCMKMDGGCRGVTPPICPGNSRQLTRLGQNGTSVSVANGSNRTSRLSHSSGSAENTNETSATRRFLRRAIAHQELPSNDPSFRPVDGDFNSQLLYVLDSTENPEKGSLGQAFETFVRRSNAAGSIVGANGDFLQRATNEVCLSTTTFGLLMAAVTVVFVAAAFVCAVICGQKLRRSHAFSTKSSDSGEERSSSCYSSVAMLWK